MRIGGAPLTPEWLNRNMAFGKYGAARPAQPRLVCGYLIPASHHCTYETELKHYGSVAAVRATYAVPGGPTFRRAMDRDLRGMLASELQRLHFDMVRTVFLAVCEEVRQHNAAVEPIDNGPFEEVARSEALTRVLMMNATCFRDVVEGLVLDDRWAAMDALEPYVGI